MQMIIEKAKIVKGETVEIHYVEINDKGDRLKASKSLKAPMHDDLKQAFKNLAIHLAIMTGYVSSKQVKDIETPKEELTEKFFVTSYSIGGNDEDQGVVISGHHKLNNGKAVILNIPFERFNVKEESRYVFMDDLQERLDRVEIELKAFFDGSKRGQEQQQKMDFGEDKPKATKLVIAEPEKPVFKGKKDDAGLHDVTEEYIEMNTQRQNKLKIPPADPDAMARVAASDIEDAHVIEEIPNTHAPAGKAKKSANKKRVAQSADAPGGIVEEGE
jgi:hypothetical protein